MIGWHQGTNSGVARGGQWRALAPGATSRRRKIVPCVKNIGSTILHIQSIKIFDRPYIEPIMSLFAAQVFKGSTFWQKCVNNKKIRGAIFFLALGATNPRYASGHYHTCIATTRGLCGSLGSQPVSSGSMFIHIQSN